MPRSGRQVSVLRTDLVLSPFRTPLELPSSRGARHPDIDRGRIELVRPIDRMPHASHRLGRLLVVGLLPNGQLAALPAGPVVPETYPLNVVHRIFNHSTTVDIAGAT